jgi:hypothetical protein
MTIYLPYCEKTGGFIGLTAFKIRSADDKEAR